MSKERLFSGIQPTGGLHIGNYLGAVKQWKELQNDYDAIFCVVDLHAITVPQDPEELRKNIINTARIFLASGLDPKESIIFAQSQIKAHSELCWILNSVSARMGDMEKMTQFKDKSDKSGSERASIGLFDYPVLMAADIILYDTVTVPVGEDQVQHVELARTLARRFNKRFGDTFIVPESKLNAEGKRIMSLVDPSKKMSKSAESELSYITMMDDADLVRKKIRKAVTDSGEEIVYTDDKPALKNLINIYSLLAEISTTDVEQRFVGKRYGDFKNELAEVIVEFLTPFQERMAQISDEDVTEVLRNGARRANVIAEEKIEEVKEKVGFVV